MNVFAACLFLLASAGSEKPAVEANNAFAFRLLSTLPEGKNAFFSPFSIASALSMT